MFVAPNGKMILFYLDKNLLPLLYTNPDKNNLQLVKTLIASRDTDVQYSAIELVGLLSEDGMPPHNATSLKQ